MDLDPEEKKRGARALYVWGRNKAGQLGIGHTMDTFKPTIVGSFEAKEVSSITSVQLPLLPLACACSLADTRTHRHTHAHVPKPSQVEVTGTRILFRVSTFTCCCCCFCYCCGCYALLQVKMIATGGAPDDPEYGGFSLALTSAGLVAFGSNKHGQLGVGDTVDRHAMVSQ